MRWRRGGLALLVLGLLGVLLAALLRGCAPEEPGPEGLLLPRDLARRFRLRDADAVIAHCRTQVGPAAYAGVLRGAHGALWAGEGNAWDRTLLAAEALAGIGVPVRILPTSPVRLAYRDGDWRVLRIDDAAPPERRADPPPDARPLEEGEGLDGGEAHTIEVAFLLRGGDGAVRRIEARAPERTATWLRVPVLLEAVGADEDLRYVLRVGAREVLASGPLAETAGAEIEFRWRGPAASPPEEGRPAERVWRRELFARENADPAIPGHAAPRAGDRYAIVLSAGPLLPEVLETRAAMLREPTHTPVEDGALRDLVLLGVRYQIASDASTREIAARARATVAMHEPRITVLASTRRPAEAGSPPPGPADRVPGLSLDALTERVEAEGPGARSFHGARGLANDRIETEIVAEAGGSPVVSATTVFSRYRSEAPDVPARRLEILAAEVQRLAAAEPVGTGLLLSAEPIGAPRGGGGPAPAALRLERTETGLVLHGVEPLPAPAAGLPTHRWAHPAARSPLGRQAGPIALLVDRLLAERTGRGDFRLRVEREPAWALEPLPVADGSVLHYRVVHGEKAFAVTVLVSLAEGTPGGVWFTQPEGSTWVDLQTPDGSRVGAIGPMWPEVVSASGIGPILDTYVAPSRGVATGSPEAVEVRVGGVPQRVPGVRVGLAEEPGPFFQAEAGGRWSPAFLVRDGDGLPLRRDDERRLHVLGSGPNAEVSRPWKRVRRLTPVEVRVDGTWRWAHLEETLAAGIAVRLLDEADAPRVEAAPGDTRPLEPAEARRGERWEAANLLERRDGKCRVRFREGDPEDDAWRPADQVRTARGTAPAAASAVLLPGRAHSLVLAWERGDVKVTLTRISPVVHGWALDAATGAPLAGAEVSRGGWSVRTAADGSFALHLDDPLFPQASFVGGRMSETHRHPAIRKTRRRDVHVLVDASEDALRGKAPVGPAAAPPGERRFDGALATLSAVLPRLGSPQDRMRVTLWVHGGTSAPTPAGAEPASALRSLGEDLRPTDVAARLADVVPAGAARREDALRAFLAASGARRGADDTFLLWVACGAPEEEGALAEAYRAARGDAPVHVFAFGVAEGTAGDRALRLLAQASGGSLRASADAPPHALDASSYRARYLDLGVVVRAPCHGAERIVLPAGDPGVAARRVVLAPDCCCRGSTARILTITRETRATLAEAEGLSPRAVRWIEERVADGAWEVRIPARRTSLGPVTAYAWFEIETATGRLVGRTEDGLHGSLADPEEWPNLGPEDLDPSRFNPHASDAFREAASQQPFVMWFQGITAYAAGSVQAAFDWRNSAGFASADPEQFKRFVQEHGIDHAAAWWADVASAAGGQLADNFWSGVCLAFLLQSDAMGLPSDACARRWAEDLCDRMRDAVKAGGTELASDAASDLLEDRFGEEHAELVAWAAGQGLGGLAEELEEQWKEGVNATFPCERLRGRPAK